LSEMALQREWRFYISDMIGFCERILSFTQATCRAEFPADAMRYDATVRNIELVGEAATHIPESVRRDHPEIPWRMMIATRNQLIHGYLGIDDDVLWSIVQTDIPTLLANLRLLQTPEQG
jgi:uncharacterized protein with HEPN domain